MDPKPDVFISAVSGDLASAREVVKNALLDIGCHPVVQTHFAPDHQSIRRMIEDKIAPCQAVIHLVGLRYGFEPKVPEVPRRSYTQIEHDVAKATGKEVYLFLCSEGYPYDTGGEPEEPVKTGLQAAHRQAIRAGDKLYTVVSTPAELKNAIHKLKIVHRAVATAASGERKEVRQGLKINFSAILGTSLLVLLLGVGSWFGYHALHEKVTTTETAAHTAATASVATHAEVQKAFADPDVLKAKLRRQIEAKAGEKIDVLNREKATYTKVLEVEKQRDTVIAKLDSLIETIQKNLGEDASPVYRQAVLILENEGIDAALRYLESNQASVFEKARAQAQLAEAETAKLHQDLEPMLLKADLHQTNLEWAAAQKILREVAEIAPRWFQARRELGELLRELAEVNEAEPHLRAALDLAGSDNERAMALNSLAFLYYDMARHAECEPLFREALEIGERLHGKDSTEVAVVLNNLALLLQATNRLEEAEPMYRRALAIAEASFGKDHPDVATTLSNLAGLLYATNRLEEAEPLMERALVIDEASFGKDHPLVANRLNNLAQLLKATNRLEEAEPMMRRALAIAEASFGKDHPMVATALNNLGDLHRTTNRLEEAEPMYRRALVIAETSFGKDHPNVARDLNNLAQLLKATNRLEEAKLLMKRALAIDEASFGKHHPNVAIRLNNLAQLLKATNRLEEAEPLMRRALVIDEASFGKDHPDVAIKLNNLAQLLKATNRLEEAEPMMMRALEILRNSLGIEHLNTKGVAENYQFLLKEIAEKRRN